MKRDETGGKINALTSLMLIHETFYHTTVKISFFFLSPAGLFICTEQPAQTRLGHGTADIFYFTYIGLPRQ
jgi:hypothetical protein